jgi:hypothetical protein
MSNVLKRQIAVYPRINVILQKKSYVLSQNCVSSMMRMMFRADFCRLWKDHFKNDLRSDQDQDHIFLKIILDQNQDHRSNF